MFITDEKMKRIDRMNLLDRLGRELQSRMTYRDIDVFLKGFGVDCKDKSPSVNSKWVYVKEVLTDVTDNVLIDIADELDIAHGYVKGRSVDLSTTKFWIPSHYRLFLSHISTFKKQTAKLQDALRAYGISAFVAHEDIEPTKEWQDEIEKALFSMDALVAILTSDFKDSLWVDHEIGAALGRDLLVIPIRKGRDPYGFIAKYQGIQGEGKTVGQVAEEIFGILASHQKTHGGMIEALVNLFISSKNDNDASHWFELLEGIEKIPTRYLEKLQANADSVEAVVNSNKLRSRVESLLSKSGLSLPQKVSQSAVDILDDDIPF